MKQNELIRLFENAKRPFVFIGSEAAGVLTAPDLEGRMFAVLGGQVINRVNPEAIAGRSTAERYLNPGGQGFWPAPEGGMFGFNYRGNAWYVQEAISTQPFEVKAQDNRSASIEKKTHLTNRAGTGIEATMTRQVKLLSSLPAGLDQGKVRAAFSYETVDTFSVLNSVSTHHALIAGWTLDQFEATEQTVSFCQVENPTEAINFDYYQHPGTRIEYFKKGFTYKTDGQCRGQIGIKKAAQASMIGFCDPSRCLVGIRENRGKDGGVYFNMADNDQPAGPYSAADNYSIFNSDPDMNAFELETVGAAQVDKDRLCGSELVSATTFAVFERPRDVDDFVKRILGT